MSKVSCTLQARLSAAKRFPAWYTKLISRGTVYYHEDFLNDFERIDAPEYADGWTLLCKHCGKEAWLRLDYMPDVESWLLVHAVCRFGCGVCRRDPRVEPLWRIALRHYFEERGDPVPEGLADD